MNYKVATLIVLILFIAVLSSFGTYYFLNRQQKQIVPTPIPTPTPISEKLVVPTETSQDIMKALTPTLNPDNNPNFNARIDVSEGNYARGTASFGGGGSGWYAVKQNGQWKIVLKTQNDPSCKILLDNKFPIAFAKSPNGNYECYFYEQEGDCVGYEKECAAQKETHKNSNYTGLYGQKYGSQ